MPGPRVKCPSCGRNIDWDPASPWRPFCSERCRLVDLGDWLRERHAIPGEPVDELAGDTLPGGEPRPH